MGKKTAALHCEVSSDGIPCDQPAAFFLVIPPGSKLYQGQEPSPRCQAHADQARQAFTDALSSYDLVPIDGKGEPAE